MLLGRINMQDCVHPECTKEKIDVHTVAQAIHPGRALHMTRNVVDVGSKTSLRQYAHLHGGQQQDWQDGKMIHYIGQEGDLNVVKTGEWDRSFDMIWIKYINFDNTKSIIFT